MKKHGIVFAVLAVAVLAGSTQAFVITNVTNDEVVFQCGYETATVGDNVQTDTPQKGTYNFMGWWSPAPGELGDSQVHHWVEDETSFLFFSRPARDEVTRLLQTRSDLDLMDDYRFTYEEWQGGGLNS